MKAETKTGRLVMVALLAALICVTAVIVVPIGPVPFSMAVMGVIFAGALLAPTDALAAVCVYLAIGMVGIPVFAGFNSGPQVVLGPTGGFLIGYLPLVFCTSIARGQKIYITFLAAFGGLLACYLLGTVWFMVYAKAGFVKALMACVVPFIIPDVIKIGGAVALARAILLRQNKARAGK